MTAENAPDSSSEDSFSCPVCDRKHRANLAAVRRGEAVRAKCNGCQTVLVLEGKGGAVTVRVADLTAPAEPAAAAPAAKPSRVPPRPAGAPKAPGEPASTIAAEFPAGTQVGRYVLEDPIGEGGTSFVYRAFDATTNRYVALKILRNDQSEAMRQRFLREIEVQANLKHPNLMPVFDRGEHEGRPYFAMELLYRPFTLTQIVEMGREGTLSRYATLRPLDELEKLIEDVYLPVCEALQVANVENGVVHADIKPDNILVDSRTLRAYVIDFGICHVLEKKTTLSTTVVPPTADEAGAVGTPRFLAPEQARGTVHERTDVWGLGAVLQFILTGDAPIESATAISRTELRRRIEGLKETRELAAKAGDKAKVATCDEKLARLEDSSLRTIDDMFKDAREGVYAAIPPTVAPALAAIARKATAPKTAERYVNPRSLAADVQAWLSGSATRAGTQEGGSTATVVDSAKRAFSRYLATGLVALVAAGVGWWLGSSGSKGGGGGGSRPDTLMAAFQRLEAQIDSATNAASSMSNAEAARRYDAIRFEYDALARDAASLGGADSERVGAKARAVLDRFAPARVRVVVPKGVATGTLEDVTRSRKIDEVGLGDIALAPGQHRLSLGKSGAIVVPFAMPFSGRKAGVSADREPVRFIVTIPLTPESVPDGWTLVVPGGDTVDHRGPPFGPTMGLPFQVKPFLLSRFETSNGDYVAFLDGITSGTERQGRTPLLDFLPDPDRPEKMTVSGSVKDKPVRGISPDDAVAYASWRSGRDRLLYRLPNEAEWAVAAGALLKFDLPGGVRGSPEDANLVEPVAVKTAKDVSPYGVLGMMGNVREIVTGVRVASDSPEAFLSKGAGPGDPPIEAHIRRVRPIAHDARDKGTGLRLARDLPSESTPGK